MVEEVMDLDYSNSNMSVERPMTITLHKWTSADKEALMALCNAVDRTFLSDRLPNPYTEADADWWLGMVSENEGKEGVWRSIWVDGQLIGSISVERKDEGGKSIGEIGYMILTLDQIIGQVFPENVASARVLEKNGFWPQETKVGAVEKGGEMIDVKFYVHSGRKI